MAYAGEVASLILDVTTAATARPPGRAYGWRRLAWRRIAGLVNTELLDELDDDDLDALAEELWDEGRPGSEPRLAVRRNLVRTLVPGTDLSAVLAEALDAAGELPDDTGASGRDAAVRAIAGQALRLTGELIETRPAGRIRLSGLLAEVAGASRDDDTAELAGFVVDLVRPGREDRLLITSDLPRLAVVNVDPSVDLTRLVGTAGLPAGAIDLPAIERGPVVIARPGLVLPQFATRVAPSLGLRPVLAGTDPAAGRRRRDRGIVLEDRPDVVRVHAAASRRPDDDPAPGPDQVNIGVVRADRPDEPIRSGALAASTDHIVWASIGPRDDEAVPGDDAGIDLDEVPDGEELDVVFFADAALRVPGAATSGSFVTAPRRPLPVHREAGPAPGEPATGGPTPVGTRLWFRIRTPAEPGRHTVRVCVYHRNVLLQARQLTVPTGRSRARRHVSVSTYDAVSSAPAATAADGEPRRLSLYVNGSDDSHDLWFRGQDGARTWEGGGHFDGAGVGDLLSVVRGGLRRASWGSAEAWTNQPYRYKAAGDWFGESHQTLRADLIDLARRGYAAWELVTSRLGSPADQDELQALMRRPGGIVEVAPKLGGTVVPPVACLYDLDLDAAAGVAALTLCPEMDQALQDRTDLATTACLRAGCTQAGPTVVCPSGFWGLRHDVAVPVSPGRGADAEARKSVGDKRPAAALIGTLPSGLLRGIDSHAQDVATRFSSHEHVTDRNTWLTEAKHPGKYAVLYFLCHGQESDRGSVIVLDTLDRPGIDRSSLRTPGVALKHHPLVVLNACDTGALEPNKAMSLVEGFAYRGAAAVIGTEITIFTSLAYAFATTFFDRFTGRPPQQLGPAVRSTRLELLRRGNPLGLAYVAYGRADAALASA